MKVGILTFHRAENFGAVLQAYALQQFIRKAGCDVEIIDYRNNTIESMYHIYNPYILITRKNIFKSLGIYLSRFNNIRNRICCKEKYKDFRNEYLNVSRKVSNVGEVAMDYDCIIAGSDQIWNLHLTGGLDRNYFLDYVKRTGMRKIAYAASSERDPKRLISCYKGKIAECLNDFDNISVREKFLKDELSDYTDNEIEVCLDPTFLLSADDYKKLTKTPIANKYVLVYHMTPIEEGSLLAERIAKKNGWRIVEIHMGYGWQKGDDRHKINLGPLEILNYITYAEVVITSSFHGLALSLIMRKNVWVIDKGNNFRQRNLLEILQLNGRMLSEVDGIDDVGIDYRAVSEILDNVINKSKRFIFKALLDTNEESRILS